MRDEPSRRALLSARPDQLRARDVESAVDNRRPHVVRRQTVDVLVREDAEADFVAVEDDRRLREIEAEFHEAAAARRNEDVAGGRARHNSTVGAVRKRLPRGLSGRERGCGEHAAGRTCALEHLAPGDRFHSASISHLGRVLLDPADQAGPKGLALHIIRNAGRRADRRATRDGQEDTRRRRTRAPSPSWPRRSSARRWRESRRAGWPRSGPTRSPPRGR